MRSKQFMFILFTVIFMISCSKDPGRIEVKWQLIENQHRGKNQHKGEVTITNHSRHTLTNDNWIYYFSWFRTVLDGQESEIIDGETINGDYSKLYPTEKFPDLEPGESIRFPLIGSHYALHRTDAPTGGYFTVKKRFGPDVIIPSGDAEVLPFRKERPTGALNTTIFR
ncbi:MAG: carbohydate-binding domain-containing protein [Candidatus Marinimicrobia bacterium]|nr:carbohydate-binding domain-containing protein [Candidatus Neomarinimicrobiota bacterium]